MDCRFKALLRNLEIAELVKLNDGDLSPHVAVFLVDLERLRVVILRQLRLTQ